VEYQELLFPSNTDEISKERAIFVAKGWGECPFWVFRSSRSAIYGLHWNLTLLGQFPQREDANDYVRVVLQKQKEYSDATDKTVSVSFNEDGTQKK
jgi:hypothetical protein